MHKNAAADVHNGLCLASAALPVGRSSGPWYATLMPSEHYDSMRTAQFPNTCVVKQLAGSLPAGVTTRLSVADYSHPYNIVTRERDELFVYGGYVGEDNGAYVAKVDPHDLSEQWRIYLTVAEPDFFNWPGALGVHGNGFLYAIAGNILAKFDAVTGAKEQTFLPEHPGQGGAAYNGFVISKHGILIAKSIERGTTKFNGLFGLRAAAENGIPAFLVAVDPTGLAILATTELPETVIGRVAIAQYAGKEYVYCPGLTKIWRYLFTGDQFILDEEWNPTYAENGEQPGTACALMNDWVFIQTNFLASTQPLKISAFHVDDCRRSYTIQPFDDCPPSHSIRPFQDDTLSQEFSKPALDPENMRVYTNDQLVGKVAGLDFNADSGFSISWQAQQRMASFWALIGPKEQRNIIGTNLTTAGDQVVWRDAVTGEELAVSEVVDAKFNGNIVSSGFLGRFYYLGVDSQKIVELTLIAE